MKVALVTGAATRLGAAMVRRLHQLQMNVVIHCNQSVAEAECLKGELTRKRPDSVSVIQFDLAEKNMASKLIEAALKPWGKIDLLVNNASAFTATPFGDIDEMQWQSIMGANLKAPFFLAQAALPRLKEVNGQIVNMLDIYAERSLPDFSVYSLSKSGLQALTLILAKELAPEIRVNGIAPGAILWPADGEDEDRKAQVLERIPLKRLGSVEAIADALQYLVDSDYITGQILSVDGGRRLLI